MPAKIILKGYYGFGNFGDDILMLAAFGWLRQQYPDAEIIICTDSANALYIPRLFSEPVTVIQNHDNVQVDWIIHGGGGVYFDFMEGTTKSLLLNKFIRTIGEKSFKRVVKIWQKLSGRKRIQAPFRAGFGIGIGTYSNSSNRLYADIQELIDFNFILVRDQQSVVNLRQLNINCPAIVSSDLAFMREYWLTDINSAKTNSMTIGIILRDWIYDDHAYFEVMEQTAIKLQAEGFAVKFFSFDRFSDTAYIKRFSEKYELDVWNPFSQTVAAFLEKISACSLMITSRAHGAIVSACLGIPSICLEIEPKLAHIATLLKNSSILLKQPVEKNLLIKMVGLQLTNIESLHKAALRDYEENGVEMLKGLASFRVFEKQHTH